MENKYSKGINILSLCDGMSCGQIALKELGIKVNRYYAFEIDKNAIKVTQDNFPNTVQMGDVTACTLTDILTLPKIDLLMFGSPCRSLSKVTSDRKNYNNGLKGVSGLFYECANILDYIKHYNNPKINFLVENVDTNKKDDLKIMSLNLGVEPVLIDSAFFSAQERKRNYWTNIELDPLESFSSPNYSLVLTDILDEEVPDKYFINKDYEYIIGGKRVCGKLNINGHDYIKRIYSVDYKSPTLTACRGGNHQVKIFDPKTKEPRKLTPNEYRKLQTIQEWYKMDVADTHIYNMCGDGWTVEVIKYILQGLKGENK